MPGSKAAPATPGKLAAFGAWIDQRCQLPFDLALRLFDTALLRTADDEYTWYLVLASNRNRSV